MNEKFNQEKFFLLLNNRNVKCEFIKLFNEKYKLKEIKKDIYLNNSTYNK